MGSCPIEVGDIAIEHALELFLMQDQQVVQALLSHAPQETFADGIGSGRMIRGFENFNGACGRHLSKARPEFAIVITNQVLWHLPIGSGFSQLLCYPGIGRGPGDSDMDDPSCPEFDEEERKERSKEEIGDLQEVARPDLRGMSAQKGCPRLPSWMV